MLQQQAQQHGNQFAALQAAPAIGQGAGAGAAHNLAMQHGMGGVAQPLGIAQLALAGNRKKSVREKQIETLWTTTSYRRAFATR